MQVGGDTLGYDSLSAALADLPSDNNVITLLKNIDLGAQVSVPANSGAATITAAENEDGTPIEITWENATASFFNIPSGAALTVSGNIIIRGTESTGQRAFDVAGTLNFGEASSASQYPMVEQFDLSTEKGIAAVYVNGGALNLYSGTLSQNKGYYGGAVSVRYNGNANLFGGTISGNTAPSGGGLYVANSTVTLSGTKISENSAQKGGGVYNQNGTVTIEQGEISRNWVDGEIPNGGGIYSDGIVTMNGGKINGNAVKVNVNEYGRGRGAAVCNNGKFTITDGEVSGNYCEQGNAVTAAKTMYCAGLYNEKQMDIAGGTISGNFYTFSSDFNNHECFAGVGVSNNGGTLTITGGTITGNGIQSEGSSVAGIAGAGVASTANSVYNAVFNMTGGKITGNNGGTGSGAGLYLENSGEHTSAATISGGSIVENKGASGVYAANANLSISGNPVISGNKNAGEEEKNLYLTSGTTVGVVDRMTSGADIGVTMAAPANGSTVATGAVASDVNGFTYDGGAFGMYFDSTDNTIKIGSAVTVTFNANTGDNSETSRQEVPSGKEVNLNPNSFKNPGKTFVKWNTKQDGSGTDYEDGDSIMANSAVNLYAQWRDRKPSHIEVTPKKDSFAYGTVLSTDDFTVTAVYDNGESEEVSDYSISPNTALTASGTVAVKITYQGVQKDVSINVEPQKQTVNVVIYRNGDFTTPYKTVALDKVPKGNAIDLSKLNITNYYTAKCEFHGWYNDGAWNEYKKNPANPPAGLSSITVNGWTNIRCMVYDYETVVCFASKEALADYQADHSKTEGLLLTVKAVHGTTLPTVVAPTETRDGYTFTFWSREGQSTDVTGQTVGGWTNLYANWKITPHNIYAFARVNSAFAPLTPVEFGEHITLNNATLTRLGLGSYNANGYISIGSFSFDKLPLVGDDFMSHYGDEEFNAVVEELAKSIMLETGVSEETANKIAWTYLFKADGSDYTTTAGYPTEDAAGYQLSGNLNLATVMFQPNGDDVTGMPEANYTYDGMEIYDFYFPGETVTMPADLTRAGYTFLGWSAKVIPSEADEAEVTALAATDANGDLLKANDTYTITDGGVVFTAQWEKNDYIIASDLRINGNDAYKDEGKNFAWTHRYGGKFDGPIEYTEMLEALKNKTLEVDAANEPCDVEIKLCFPGSEDKLFNEAITTYGQTGGGWNPGVKNTAFIWGYATTSYEVTFDSDGGSDVEKQIVKYGETLEAFDAPTKKGYNFVGWVDKNGDSFNLDTAITHKTELKAQWEKKSYTVAANMSVNGAAPYQDGKTYAWTVRVTGKYGEAIPYDDIYAAIKAKALVADAASEPNSTKVDVVLKFAGSNDIFDETIKTFGQDGATWQEKNNNTCYVRGFAYTYYDVTFVTPEGATTVDAELIKRGEEVTQPDDPTKAGWKFLGWYADADFNTEFNFSDPITKKTSVYAKFELNQTPAGDIYVRYDVQHIKQLPDGTYDEANAEIEHLSAKAKTTPSKPNYPFSSSVMNFFDPLYTIKFEIATQENK